MHILNTASQIGDCSLDVIGESLALRANNCFPPAVPAAPKDIGCSFAAGWTELVRVRLPWRTAIWQAISHGQSVNRWLPGA